VFTLGCEKSNRGPTVLTVADVNVRPLRVFDPERDEAAIQESNVFIIGECDLIHSLAETAPESSEK
jgi:hypothetical protein